MISSIHRSFIPGEVAELVECAGLENRYTRKGIVGSNPTLSAIFLQSNM